MSDEQEVLYEDQYLRVTKITEYTGEPDLAPAFTRMDELLGKNRGAQRELEAAARLVTSGELKLFKKELQTVTAAVVALTIKMDQFGEAAGKPRRRWYYRLFGVGNETK